MAKENNGLVTGSMAKNAGVKKGLLKRESAFGAIANMGGTFIGMANNIWLLPLLFTLGEIGFFRWMERTSMFLAQILMLGINRVYIKFHDQLTAQERRELMQTLLALSAMVVVVFALAVLGFQERITESFDLEEFTEHLPLLIFFTASLLWFNFGSGVASTQGKVGMPFVWRAFGLRLFLFLTGLAVLGQWLNYDNWLLLQVGATFAVGVGILAWSLHRTHYRWSGWRMYRGAKSGEMRVFGRYVTLNSFLAFGLNTLDIQFITFYLGLDQTGVYSIAAFIASFVDGIKRPLSQSAVAQFSKFWNSGNHAALVKYYRRTAVVLTFLAVGAFVAIVPQLDLLFHLIPGSDRFLPAAPLVFYLLLARIIDYSVGYSGEAMANGPYFRINLYMSSSMLVLLAGANMYLIPKYGLIGAPIAFLAVNSTFNLGKMAFLYAKTGWHPFTWRQAEIWAVGAVAYFVLMAIPSEGWGAWVGRFSVLIPALIWTRFRVYPYLKAA